METRTSLFDTLFNAAISPYTKEMKLAAIWVTPPVITANGKTARITKGDLIKACNGRLIDCHDTPTHEVIECMGTLADVGNYFLAKNILTNEIEKIKP